MRALGFTWYVTRASSGRIICLGKLLMGSWCSFRLQKNKMHMCCLEYVLFLLWVLLGEMGNLILCCCR